jgi:hypothetical protein
MAWISARYAVGKRSAQVPQTAKFIWPSGVKEIALHPPLLARRGLGQIKLPSVAASPLKRRPSSGQVSLQYERWTLGVGEKVGHEAREGIPVS